MEYLGGTAILIAECWVFKNKGNDMKKLLFAVAALSVLAPFTGTAEPTHPNEIGLYTTPDGYGATETDVIGAPVEVYLVLTKPEVENEPDPHVFAFDGQLNFNPVGQMSLISITLGGEGLNVGDVDHVSNGWLEFITGFASPGIPSINDAVLLATITLVNNNFIPVEITLGPCSLPAIPGQMVYLSDNNVTHILHIMHPVSGSQDAPVFIFNGEAVPVEDESFGSVKALYR
jgi:hypothetical protein